MERNFFYNVYSSKLKTIFDISEEINKMEIKQLYDRDFNLWIEHIKTALINQDIHNMDWENLLDEVDDMGKSEKRSLESYLERLIEHILKLQYWNSEYHRNYKHWQVEVNNFRNRIKRLLRRSPSLQRYMKDIYPEVFQDAVSSWQIEFDIPENSFIDLDLILQKDYFG